MVESWENKRTICYTLREIAECCAIATGSAGNPLAVIEQCSKAVELCNEAADMAKRMDKKLRENKEDYAKTFYDDLSGR